MGAPSKHAEQDDKGLYTIPLTSQYTRLRQDMLFHYLADLRMGDHGSFLFVPQVPSSCQTCCPSWLTTFEKKTTAKNKCQLPFQDLLDVVRALDIYPASMEGSWEASESKMRNHSRAERNVLIKPEYRAKVR